MSAGNMPLLYEVAAAISNPTITCICAQYSLRRRLLESRGVYDILIIPCEKTLTLSKPECIIRIFMGISPKSELITLIKLLQDEGLYITSFIVQNLTRGVYDAKITTTVLRSENVRVKSELVRAHVGSLTGIWFSGVVNMSDIMVIHDESLTKPEAVRQVLEELVEQQQVLQNVEARLDVRGVSPTSRVNSTVSSKKLAQRLSEWVGRPRDASTPTNVKLPLCVSLNSLIASTLPRCKLLDATFLPFTLRSLWIFFSGTFGFLCLVDVTSLPFQTIKSCGTKPGFATSARIRVTLSIILLFVGLFSLFLAILIEHGSSPRFSLQCISFSNFVLAAPVVYRIIGTRLRSVFLHSHSYTGSANLLPLIDSTKDMNPGSTVSIKQGDLILSDCQIVSCDTQCTVSVPPFVQSLGVEACSTRSAAPTSSAAVFIAEDESDRRVCRVGDILYQGQQVLSGQFMVCRVLQHPDLSVTRLLLDQSNSQSMDGAYVADQYPWMKRLARYFGLLAALVFIAVWWLKLLSDPDYVEIDDESILSVLPRITLVGVLFVHAMIPEMFYDGINVMLMYIKQILYTHCKVISTHTASLLVMRNLKEVVLNLGPDEDLVSCNLLDADTLQPTILWHQLEQTQAMFCVRIRVTGSSPSLMDQIHNQNLLPATWEFQTPDEERVQHCLTIYLSDQLPLAPKQSMTSLSAYLITSKRYCRTAHLNALFFIESFSGLLSLYHFSEYCQELIARAFRFAGCSTAILLVYVISLSKYSHYNNGHQMLLYFFGCLLATNAPLFLTIIQLSFNVGPTRNAIVQHNLWIGSTIVQANDHKTDAPILVEPTADGLAAPFNAASNRSIIDI